MKKSYYLPLILCLPIIAAIGENSFSQETASRPTVMDEVVVTESRVEETKREVTSNLSVITREHIDKSAATDLGDLLAEFGLGHIQKYPGALTSIGIRGFRTDTHGNDLQGKVLILLDGRRAGSGNAAKLKTKNVERVEIIRGPGAVQYGSAGIGGVVNIITRKGVENSLFVEGGYGSFEKAEGSIGGTAAARGIDFSGALNFHTSEDYNTGNGDTFINTGVDEEVSVSLNAGYTFLGHHRVGMTFTGFNVEGAGNPGYLSIADSDDYSDKSNYSLDTIYTGSTSDEKSQWMARFFFGRDENIWVNPIASNPDGYDDGIDSKNATDQLGAQVQYSTELGNQRLTAGFDWIDYQVENSWAPQEASYSNPAMFLIAKGSYLEDTFISNLGLRYDWFEVEVLDPAGRKESTSRLTPKIGFSWLPHENLKLRVQYAHGFMMPTANQLAVDMVSWGTRTVGNPDLDPEKSQTYEAGLDFNYGAFSAAFTYFYNDFEDKIVTTTLPGGEQSWDNVGNATVAGFELETGYDIGQSLDWQWELRPYLNATFLTDFKDEVTGLELMYTSETNLSAGVVASDGNGTFCRLNVTHYSDQMVTDYEAGWPYADVVLDAITVTDLTAAWKFLEHERLGDFTVRGEIENLFDEEYAYVKGSPMPGISFFMSLRWDY